MAETINDRKVDVHLGMSPGIRGTACVHYSRSRRTLGRLHPLGTNLDTDKLMASLANDVPRPPQACLLMAKKVNTIRNPT